jgi:hypothetical protein
VRHRFGEPLELGPDRRLGFFRQRDGQDAEPVAADTHRQVAGDAVAVVGERRRLRDEGGSGRGALDRDRFRRVGLFAHRHSSVSA